MNKADLKYYATGALLSLAFAYMLLRFLFG